MGVLRELGYVSADGTVTLKGRAACEVNSTQDELLATELLFRGVLQGLAPEEAVALMSALVFQVWCCFTVAAVVVDIIVVLHCVGVYIYMYTCMCEEGEDVQHTHPRRCSGCSQPHPSPTTTTPNNNNHPRKSRTLSQSCRRGWPARPAL